MKMDRFFSILAIPANLRSTLWRMERSKNAVWWILMAAAMEPWPDFLKTRA